MGKTLGRPGQRSALKQLHYGRHSLSGSSGAALATRGWCTALGRAGVDVELAVDAGSRRLPCPEGITCSSLRHVGTRKVAAPVGLRARLEHAETLVVHAGLRAHTALAGRAASRVGKPYVVSTHGIYIQGARARKRLAKSAAARLFERSYLRGAAATHVYFEDELNDLRALGVTRPAIVAMPGVEVPDGIRWDGGSGGYLLWLGRFDPIQKDLLLLLEALALFPTAERPQLRLVGPDWRGHRTSVVRAIKERALEAWATVHEPVYGDEKWRLLSAATGFVYPSRYEAFGMSLAEAVAVGVPSLATPFSLSRILSAHDAVLMCERSPEPMAAKMRDLLSEDARALAATAARVARSVLSWEVSAKNWLEQAIPILSSR